VSSQVQQAREAFGARLREIRRDANLTGRALASRSGLHFTKVSRLEHGRQNPSDDDIRAWCRACDAEEQIPDLIATLRGIEGMWLEWKRQLRAGLKGLQESSVPLYEQTRIFRIYESIVIPGILQTAGYSAAVLRIASELYDSNSDIDSAVEARMDRQRYLYRGSRRFAFVLEPWALETIFGGPDIMLDQLDRLLAAMALPRVSLGIIPPNIVRKMWPGEGFWIFDDDQVKIETTSAGMKVTQPQEIALYVKAFKALQEEAVYGQAARELIHAVIDRMLQLRETS
jgi:transcriptional regulator with XRE-family HTH domain